MFYYLTYRLLAFSEVNLPQEVLMLSSQSSQECPTADNVSLFPIAGGRGESTQHGEPCGCLRE